MRRVHIRAHRVAGHYRQIGTSNRRYDRHRRAKQVGKRRVHKHGWTSNQYGRFRNHVGRTYYESRANRSDRNRDRSAIGNWL